MQAPLSHAARLVRPSQLSAPARPTFIPGALPQLKSLQLSRNQLGDEGLVALAAPLRRRRGLASLRLYENRVGDRGLLALLSGLGSGRPCAIWTRGTSEVRGAPEPRRPGTGAHHTPPPARSHPTP